MTTPNTQESITARKQSTSMKEIPNFSLNSSQDIPIDKRPTYSKQVGASSDSDFNSTSMENLGPKFLGVKSDKEREKIEKEKEKQDKKIEKEREKIAEKLEKEFEKIDKDREKKEGERDKNLERRIEKIEKERDKEEKDKLDGKDMMFAFLGQRTRLHELFGQIEKEFELLWEENADLRRKLEDVRHGYSRDIEKSSTTSAPIVKRVFSENSYGSISSKLEKSRLNPLKKKEKDEWERITNFVGHRDGICDMTTPKWEKHTFMTASADRTARVWSSDSFNPVYIYMGHKGSVNSVRCHPTTRLICTGGGDSSIHIWKLPKPNEKSKEVASEANVKPWTPLLEKNQSPQEGIIPPEEPPQQQHEASFGVLMITRSLMEFKHKGPVVAADWVGPGDRIVSASWDRTIKYWTLENGRIMLDIDAGLSEPTAYITNVTAHPVTPLVMTSSSDTYFRLWDIRSPQTLAATVQAHSDVVTTAVFSPIDENIIVTGSDDRTVKIWDRRNLKIVRNVIRCSGAVNRLALSPLTSQLVIPMDDCRTKVCDLSGKQLGRLKSETKHRHRLMLSTAAWSGDESVIFTAGWDKSVIAWAQPKRFSAN